MTFKLLVVDDEAVMRKGIANFIDWDSMDCKVAGTAGNGIEAIEFIKTNSAYLPSFQERLSNLGIRLEHYYIAAFQLVPLENDTAFLKNIIVNEKKDAYCYRYNNLVIAVYFLDHCYEYVPGSILENCQEIAVIARMLDSRQISVGSASITAKPLTFPMQYLRRSMP